MSKKTFQNDITQTLAAADFVLGQLPTFDFSFFHVTPPLSLISLTISICNGGKSE
jgi:hypothetical protein